MAEQEGDHAHRQQFAKAIARLARDSDPGEQNYGIERDYNHATNESFLFRNDGEDEIIMLACAGQETQRVLLALPLAFAP